MCVIESCPEGTIYKMSKCIEPSIEQKKKEEVLNNQFESVAKDGKINFEGF